MECQRHYLDCGKFFKNISDRKYRLKLIKLFNHSKYFMNTIAKDYKNITVCDEVIEIGNAELYL